MNVNPLNGQLDFLETCAKKCLAPRSACILVVKPDEIAHLMTLRTHYPKTAFGTFDDQWHYSKCLRKIIYLSLQKLHMPLLHFCGISEILHYRKVWRFPNEIKQ